MLGKMSGKNEGKSGWDYGRKRSREDGFAALYQRINRAGQRRGDHQWLKKGSWQFPDESATIICQVESLTAPAIRQAETIRFELRGPGIPQLREISVGGLNPALLEPWRQCNREYPQGLDWILVDRSGQVCCLPRSTKFTEELF